MCRQRLPSGAGCGQTRPPAQIKKARWIVGRGHDGRVLGVGRDLLPNAPAPDVPNRQTLAPSAPPARRSTPHSGLCSRSTLEARGQRLLHCDNLACDQGQPLRPSDETAQSPPARPRERRPASRSPCLDRPAHPEQLYAVPSGSTQPPSRSHPVRRPIRGLIGYQRPRGGRAPPGPRPARRSA
jgi:hypothetical protein